MFTAQTARENFNYHSLGCWKLVNRSIPSIEGDINLGQVRMEERTNAVESCSKAAGSKGYSIFAVEVWILKHIGAKLR